MPAIIGTWYRNTIFDLAVWIFNLVSSQIRMPEWATILYPIPQN